MSVAAKEVAKVLHAAEIALAHCSPEYQGDVYDELQMVVGHLRIALGYLTAPEEDDD